MTLVTPMIRAPTEPFVLETRKRWTQRVCVPLFAHERGFAAIFCSRRRLRRQAQYLKQKDGPRKDGTALPHHAFTRYVWKEDCRDLLVRVRHALCE